MDEIIIYVIDDNNPDNWDICKASDNSGNFHIIETGDGPISMIYKYRHYRHVDPHAFISCLSRDLERIYPGKKYSFQIKYNLTAGNEEALGAMRINMEVAINKLEPHNLFI